jgi:L-amino acid N-acyltransferase YncA
MLKERHRRGGQFMVGEAGASELGTIQAYTLGSREIAQFQVPGVRFIALTSVWEERLADSMGLGVREVRRRQTDAGTAVLALADNRIACYGWVLHGLFRIPELRLEAPLPANHVYIWDCLTLPRYRGRGIFPALLHHMIEELRGQGIRQAWAATAPGNRSSMRAFAKAGFRLVAYTEGGIGTFAAMPTAQATSEEAVVLRASFRM